MKPPCFCSYEGAYDEALLAHICAAEGIAPLVARALVRRGLAEDASVHAFLHPSEADLLDPLTLPDMEAAVRRIMEAIACDERICVYGDYDADGVCATAILIDCLRGLGADVFYYIPSRHSEGYGMHPEAIERIAGLGARLIVTVDNGIAATDEAALCADYGMDLIITDHHLPPERLPDALAVVAASRSDSAYGNPALCGAGVAFKLAITLNPEHGNAGWLSLAAVATVADVVPLLGENRSLVSLGLSRIVQNPGLAALLACAGHAGRPVTGETVAFLIAPRLNAAGRMGDAARAVELLLAPDAGRAGPLAAALEEENRARRSEEQHILMDIEERYPEDALDGRRSIVLRGSDWHLGVIGIVASRLCERYHCPVLLFGERDGVLIGSCRSVPDVNLHDCLRRLASHLVQFGGHARAAGVMMEPERFDAFVDAFEDLMWANYPDDAFIPGFPFEEDVLLADLTLPAVCALQALAPFGEGNPEPVFRIVQAELCDVRQIGQQGAHLSATVLQGQSRMRAVGFGFGARAGDLCAQGRWTLLATPKINAFGGAQNVELQLSAAFSCDVLKVLRAFLTKVLYNTVADYDKLCELFFLSHGCSPFQSLSISPEALRRRYVRLRSELGKDGIAAADLLKRTDPEELWALCLFLELGFFAPDPTGERVVAIETPGKRSLQDSALYRMAARHAQ